MIIELKSDTAFTILPDKRYSQLKESEKELESLRIKYVDDILSLGAFFQDFLSDKGIDIQSIRSYAVSKKVDLKTDPIPGSDKFYILIKNQKI